MALPSVKEVEELHRKYAPTDQAFDSVWEHVSIVSVIAKSLIEANKVEIDKDLVEIGCLLHDIGVYKLYGADGKIDTSNYITHGIIGYKLLKDEGYADYLCNFPRNHIGVGVTKEDIVKQKLPLPEDNYVPTTKEEQLVAYADKFHSKSNPAIFNSTDYYKKFLSDKFGEYKVEIFNALIKEFGEPELPPIMQLFHYSIDRIR